MTQDAVLTGYRQRLFTLAEEIGVRPACRAMGGSPLDLLPAQAPGRSLGP